ncbi:hypothetical protein C8Q74DRAFT_1227641 [Fomes fomentarius]|nr:hypothetical protein C8Q74DRAFT_1227641 [Fomes fomentarius]
MNPTTQFVQASAESWSWAVRSNNCLTLVGFAILYYDYTLTISNEIDFFWKSANVSLVSALFVIIRYYGLLGAVPLIVEYFADLSEQRCRQLQTYHQAFAISIQALVAVMLVIRTYALYDRSKKVLALLIISHVGGGAACLISIVTTKSPVQTVTPLPFTYYGCNLSLTNEQGIHLALAWAAMLWFDTTIFVLTLVQALRMRRRFPGALLELMFRDGTVYYGILVTTNVANMITFLISSSGSPLKGMDTTLTNVLSTTLTSRLILNLRDPSLRRARRLGDNNLASTTRANETTAASSHTLTQIEVSTEMTVTEYSEEASRIGT